MLHAVTLGDYDHIRRIVLRIATHALNPLPILNEAGPAFLSGNNPLRSVKEFE